MKCFPGASNTYRRLTKHFAIIAAPLNVILKMDSGVTWGEHVKPTDKQSSAFDELKARLRTPPFLAVPVLNRPHMLDCDASLHAIGDTLLLQQDNEQPTD